MKDDEPVKKVPWLSQEDMTERKPFTSKTAYMYSEVYKLAQTYIDGLAKPIGSLGTLEEWAARYAALHYLRQRQGSTAVSLKQQDAIEREVAACALIFVADHGIAKSPNDGGEGCSAYPQVVTQSIVKALKQQVAGASTLAKSNGVQLRVIDVGVNWGDENIKTETGSVVVPGSFQLQGGTQNACQESAIPTFEKLDLILQAGRDAVKRAQKETRSSLICLGEVGIGNTTTSSILLAAMNPDAKVSDLVDGGATFGSKNVDQELVARKVKIVESVLIRFRNSKIAHPNDQQQSAIRIILKELGGAEIVAMVGAILEAYDQNLPVMIDGFIVTVAALAACRICPEASRCLFFATRSSEKGQQVALNAITRLACESNVPPPSPPVLSMYLRMGECTGAILAVPIFQSAVAMISNMATLQDILSN